MAELITFLIVIVAMTKLLEGSDPSDEWKDYSVPEKAPVVVTNRLESK